MMCVFSVCYLGLELRDVLVGGAVLGAVEDRNRLRVSVQLGEHCRLVPTLELGLPPACNTHTYMQHMQHTHTSPHTYTHVTHRYAAHPYTHIYTHTHT